MGMTHTLRSVCIVGGGLGGLVAAASLARSGHSVTLLEATARFGGLAATDVVGDGYHLNLGPHALYRGGPAEAVLRELGLTPTGGRPPTRGVLLRDGRAHALPAGPGSLLSTGALRLGQRVALGLAYSQLLMTRAGALQGSVGDHLATLTADPDVRAVLEATVRVATYADCPEALPASLAVAQVQSAVRHGVLYLDGGWQSLVDGLVTAARAAGARLVSGWTATAVRAGAVSSAEETLEADEIVLALPMPAARALLRTAGPTSAAQADALPDAMGPPVRAACLDVALRRLPRPKPTLALGLDEPVYVSVHTAVADLAPEGGAVIHAAMYLSPDHDRRPAADRAVLEATLDTLQPGWRDEVVHQRFLPRMTVVSALPPLAGLGARPSVVWAPGLWLCGDWVGAQGYLADASCASGAEVARCIGAAQVRAA
jgi:phytoene dehydrogenase-like protein